MEAELKKDVEALKRFKEMKLDKIRLTKAKLALAKQERPEPVEESVDSNKEDTNAGKAKDITS